MAPPGSVARRRASTVAPAPSLQALTDMASTGKPAARESDEQLRRRYGFKELPEKQQADQRKWSQVQHNRLQEMLSEVQRGDTAAMNRRWAYAMTGSIPEAERNRQEMIERR